MQATTTIAVLLAKLPLGARNWYELGAAAAVFVGGGLLATLGGNCLIGRLIDPFQQALEKERRSNQAHEKRGFDNGGKYIGHLERLLIYLFVLMGKYEGVGFLVAAKSVFRFGELSEAAGHNRMEAEYITIGTLLSFAWGFLISLGTKLALDIILHQVAK